MLRGVVGDETFFRAMRAFYERHAFGTVLTDDLRQIFEEVSGRPLDWFFDQWVFQPGHPVLESEWEMSGDGSEVVLTVRQTQSADWPTFRTADAGARGARRNGSGRRAGRDDRGDRTGTNVPDRGSRASPPMCGSTPTAGC